MSLPKLTIRPPPNRGYQVGYIGIPTCDPDIADKTSRAPDPIINLPLLARPAACLTGTVEVKLPAQQKGVVKALYLRVELEKIETLPQTSTVSAGQKYETSKEMKFVELIGAGPEELLDGGEKLARTKSKKSKAKKVEDDDDGWEVLKEGEFPFSIELPAGLPPSVEVDFKGAGIRYQLVATLCVRGKKGLFQAAAKPSLVVDQTPVIVVKADMLTTWPVYSPLLTSALKSTVPWHGSQNGWTTGEVKDVRTKLGDSRNGTDGEARMVVARESSVYGPSDEVSMAVEITWSGSNVIKLTRLDCVLREAITSRTTGGAQRGLPRVNTIFSANAVWSNKSNDPTNFATLVPGVDATFHLAGLIPTTHSRMTVQTAKYIEVSYHLKIRAMIEGGHEIALEWPVLINHCGRRESNALMREIGWVEGLCDRADASRTQSAPSVAERRLSRPMSPDLPPSAPLASSPSFGTVSSAALPVSQPSSMHTESIHSSSQPHVSPIIRDSRAPSPPPALSYSFVPSPTAAEEKRRLHEQASRTRDDTQAWRAREIEAEASAERLARESQAPPEDLKAAYGAVHASSNGNGPSRLSYSALRQAGGPPTIVTPREFVQRALGKAPEQRTQEEKDALEDLLNGQLGSSSGIARSNTMVAWSGSTVSEATSPNEARDPSANQAENLSSPPVTSTAAPPALLRSQTMLSSAEQEKKRLFEAAKETARQRQAEAQAELERQNAVLREMEEREAEEERLRVALAERDALEQAEAQRRRIAEETWAKEEAERQKRERAKFEERMREEEERRVAELQLLAERHRADEEDRKDLMLKRRMEENRRAEQQQVQERATQQARENAHRQQQLEEDQRRKHEEDQQSAQMTRLSSESAVMSSHAQQYPTPQGYGQYQSSQPFGGAPGPASLELGASGLASPLLPPQRPFAGATHGALMRSGSVASSFAPSTSLQEADVNFYANAIASGTAQDSALQEEKSAYLRQLRERSPHVNGNGSTKQHYHFHTSPATGLERAYTEPLQHSASSLHVQAQPEPRRANSQDDVDGLPSYPAQSPAAPKTASEEKAALTAYNAARAAVVARSASTLVSPATQHQQSSQSSPLRQVTEAPTSPLEQPVSNQASSPGPHAHRYSQTSSEDSSFDLHQHLLKRDPTVSAGKRPALRSVSGASSSAAMSGTQSPLDSVSNGFHEYTSTSISSPGIAGPALCAQPSAPPV